MGDVLKHPMHDNWNSTTKYKEKPNKKYGEDDTKSKDDADDSPCHIERSFSSNRLHTVAAAAPRSAFAGKQTPKKGIKVNFPKYYLDKAKAHESRYRRPLQPTRRAHGPDSFKFGTLCE